MTASPRRPPTTPPTIGPVLFVDEEECKEIFVEEVEVEVEVGVLIVMLMPDMPDMVSMDDTAAVLLIYVSYAEHPT